MNPTTADVFIAIFSGMLIACLAIQFIASQIKRKDRMLAAFRGCDHIDMELLANNKMMVAVVKATNQLFDQIPDADERKELFLALEEYTQSDTLDRSKYTLLGLTKRLSNEGLLSECATLSSSLKSLCREALRTVNNLNSDSPTVSIDLTLFKKMLAFSLDQVRLTDVHVHA